jgi:hypothetical protein
MKIIENTKLINRNKKISKYSSYGALALLALGFYFTLKEDTTSMIYSLVALLLGLVVWQVSMFFTSRWGAKVCPHELITSALKGLDDKFTLYHYATPVSHFLTSPSGLWILLPVMASGKVSYKNGKWAQKGGSFFLKMFSLDSLGRPDTEAGLEIRDLQKALVKHDIEIDPEVIRPLALFFNKNVTLDLKDAPITCLSSDKAKDFLLKKLKTPLLTDAQMDKLKSIITIKIAS